MNIITELRDLADLYGGSLYEDREMSNDLHRIADRLEQSGALVPVPDGKPCEIRKIAICQCFVFLRNIFRLYSFSPDEFGAWQLSDHTEHLFSPSVIVQPIRLVPLKEWDPE